MKRLALAAMFALGCVLMTARVSHASVVAIPPPPPPPDCQTCGGPPPPPTPVPTLAPTVVPTQAVVDVHLATSKVSRGHEQKVDVAASTDDQVTLQIRYKDGKAKVYRARVGSTGTSVTAWKIPKDAAVGKALIKISVVGSEVFSKTLSFVVTK